MPARLDHAESTFLLEGTYEQEEVGAREELRALADANQIGLARLPVDR